MSGPTATAPSPILALHARYEAAWAEYNRIDDARTTLDTQNREDRIVDFRYEEAMAVSGAEANALRVAILYQVPTTWQEAMILQFHIWSVFEPENPGTANEQSAMATAIDTLFDFMCDEIEHEDVEGQFQTGEHLVSQRRRNRTGKLGR